MRLWHYSLLPYLENQHIVSQWRELLAIKGAIDKNGTPNHRLVNKVLDYSIAEFKTYTILVVEELKKREIRFDKNKYLEIIRWESEHFTNKAENEVLYASWHNKRYLRQCFYNLEEKADCGIVGKTAWDRISLIFSTEKD